MSYNNLLAELVLIEKKYEQEKKELRKKENELLLSFCLSRDELKKKIRKVCPHKDEEYVDNWHPHTRDGRKYYRCIVCDRERDV